MTAAALAATAAACGDQRLDAYDRGPPTKCPNTQVGYAFVAGMDANGGVTPPTNGGNDSTTPGVTVNNVADLITELRRSEPRVIFLDGMLTATETIQITTNRSVPGGNKTLIGVGDSSGLTGAGLDLSYASNVILQNLKITKVSVGEGDAITLLAAHHIWIDHCDLSSERDNPTANYDGLVDITHGSSNITVSWTLFHDHKDTSLVGHTSDLTQMVEDAALSVTYHHNRFLNVNSGPRVRFGTAHVFSNQFRTVTSFGVASESFAGVEVDHNVFDDDVPLPITTMYQDPNGGTMTETSNKFPAGFTPNIVLAAPPVMVPYAYSSDSADSVSTIVGSCAGTGKINLLQ
jgi:pectate lyase